MFAQEIEWQNTIGGSGDDRTYSVNPVATGGYLIGGASTSDISGDKTDNSRGFFDYWIVKLNETGSVDWQSTVGGSDLDELLTAYQLSDGLYLLAGASQSGISGEKTENSHGLNDFWILKMDSAANILWQNTIGGNNQDILHEIRPTSDGNFIAAGYSHSDISGDKTEPHFGNGDYWVMKISAWGAIGWQKTFGGTSQDWPTSIQETADGGYIVGGRSHSNISGNKTENSIGNSIDYWILKLDAAGNIVWQETIGGTDADYLRTVLQTPDGGYLLGGYSISGVSGDKTEPCKGNYDYWIVKTDSLGAIEWQKTIGGSGSDQLQSIVLNQDGTYFISGKSASNISGDKNENCLGGDDIWLVKLSAAGALIWQNTIGGSNDDVTFHNRSATAAGNGFIISSYSKSDISGDKTENNLGSNNEHDYWILKICDNIDSANVVSCGPYTVPGNGLTYYSSGTYTYNISNPSGCDTTMVLHLTVLNSQISVQALGPTSFCRGDSVVLSATTGLSSWQWYRGFNALSGAVGPSFTAKRTGTYYCIGMDANGCSDTSNSVYVHVPCLPHNPTGSGNKNLTDESDDSHTFDIIPNPSNGEVTFTLATGRINIYDITGRMMLSLEVTSGPVDVDLTRFPPGIYTAISTDSGRLARKLFVIE